MLSEEQAEQIRNQIISRIDSNFPEDKREDARQQILSMNPDELENFVSKNSMNNLTKENKCIFCSIISGEAESYRIDEKNNAVAVLEINPISKGHVLIIPKEHAQFKKGIPKSLSPFVNKISKKLEKKLKPKKLGTTIANLFGHSVISIFPVYNNENANSKRRAMTPEELEEMQKLILEEHEKTKKPKTEKIKEKIRLP